MHSIQDLIINISDGTREAHAFACEGTAGETRTAFINELAAGLLCTSPQPETRPCRKCPSCIQAYAGTSMDIVHMSRSTGSSKSGRETYRVDDAAAFTERLSMGSYGRYLIGIIDEADDLSETIQNKLLKTLEEPAADTIIILGVSNRDNLLGTVRSRLSFIRISEYSGYTDSGDAGRSEDEEQSGLLRAAESIAGMYAGGAAFYEVRNALEKNIKSKEDALFLLRVIEDEFRERMTSAVREGSYADAAACACAIEKTGTAVMDVRRDMNHMRALKRLYLEL